LSQYQIRDFCSSFNAKKEMKNEERKNMRHATVECE
jgi:hypothetical protein